MLRVDLGEVAADVQRARGSGASAAPFGAMSMAPAELPLAASLADFEPDDPLLARVGAWTGSALATAVLLDAAKRASTSLPLVIAVGQAVRRGLPTAARATVAGCSPLNGFYSEGQIGGELGRRLAGVADALVLEGMTVVPGAVLHVGAGGTCALVGMPELVGATLPAAAALLNERFGPSGALVVGPAGENGVVFASLANAEDPPSHVGRGGLGAAFGALGLKALVVTAPLPAETTPIERLARTLTQSPRLRMRAEGGTLELMHAFAARGDLRTQNFAHQLDRKSSARWSESARSAPHERKGCRGCPTPCGPVFRGASGERQGARFGSVYALGPNLGLDDLEAGLGLLQACDAAGLDAKEMGATLAILCVARERGLEQGPALWGERERLIELIDATSRGTGIGARLARGSQALARELGLEIEARVAKGQAARPEANLAAVLGQCVSSRGADPIKSFPFLSSDAADRERLEELIEPLTLPDFAEDPRRPEGKGRLVWWHENLALAIDATGFCAFSAAALLSDGLVSMDELGEWLLPSETLEALGGEGGRALLALGATLALLQRELNIALGLPDGADRPTWARPQLELDGMWSEYRVLRGLDDAGRPTQAARALLGTPELVELGFLELEDPYVMWPRQGRKQMPSQEPGRCTVRSFGPLARAFGAETRVLLQLPMRTDELVDQLARRSPECESMLLRNGRPVAAIYRGGRRLVSGDWVEDGDELDVVVAISGG